MFSADIVSALIRDPESEWLDLYGKPLDQRRLAKELKRYGIESQEVRIATLHRKGYVVDTDTGLAQAWRRYLSSGSKRDKRDKRDNAGQSVADVSRTERERDKRDTNATTEIVSEQRLFGNVADVADVADTDGNAKCNGYPAEQFVPPSGPGRCDGCGYYVQIQGHRDGCQQQAEVRS